MNERYLFDIIAKYVFFALSCDVVLSLIEKNKKKLSKIFIDAGPIFHNALIRANAWGLLMRWMHWIQYENELKLAWRRFACWWKKTRFVEFVSQS